jgi:hypothetical protein
MNMLDPYYEYPHSTIPGTSTSDCGTIDTRGAAPPESGPALSSAF